MEYDYRSFMAKHKMPIDNQNLLNAVPITPDQYLRFAWCNQWKDECFAQLTVPGIKPMVDVYLTWVANGGGVVARADVDWGRATTVKKSWGDDPSVLIITDGEYATAYKFWRVGCEHKNASSRLIGPCLHEYTCPDCGERWTLDSSD